MNTSIVERLRAAGMSAPEAASKDRLFARCRGALSSTPSHQIFVPGRLEFAIEVRRRILADRPAVVAIELPETLEESYLEAIQRLPQVSVIFYNDPAIRSRHNEINDESEQSIYVPVEPADPFVEAVRSAATT